MLNYRNPLWRRPATAVAAMTICRTRSNAILPGILPASMAIYLHQGFITVCCGRLKVRWFRPHWLRPAAIRSERLTCSASIATHYARKFAIWTSRSIALGVAKNSAEGTGFRASDAAGRLVIVAIGQL